MSNLILPRQRPTWGPDASTLPVRVTYRVKGQRATMTRTMPHREYWEFVMNQQATGYELVHAEQVMEA